MALDLQAEQLSAPQLRQKLEPALREMRGPATLGDIVAATGLPAERTEPVLRSLLDEFNGKLAVDENGQLIYGFPRGLMRDATLKEKLAQLAASAWLGIKLAYKVGISVMLVVYFVIFVLIAVALLVALMSRGGDSDADLGGIDLDGCGDGCGNVFFWMPMPVPVDSQPYVRYDRYGRPYRTQAAGRRRRQRDPDALPFWRRVYEFVFGPDEVKPEALAIERELLEYLREHRGRITAVELAGLRGIDLEAAEKLALHLMVEHGGDVEVSERGTLIYRFDDLMVSAQDAPAQAERTWSWWWQRSEPTPTLNQNTAGQNATIIGLNLFNLIASATLWQYLWTMGLGLLAVWGLGIIPFVFSSTLFIIPLLRRLRLPRARAAAAERNKRRGWLQRLFSGQREFEYEGDIDLAAFARDYEGEQEVDERGNTTYRFDRVGQELADVEAERDRVDPRQWRLGPIHYDSDEN